MFDGKPFAYWAANFPGIVNSVTMPTLHELSKDQMTGYYTPQEIPLLTPMALKFWMEEEINRNKYVPLSSSYLSILTCATATLS